MNILILCPKVPYPPKDGGAIATLGLARGLANYGSKITLLCLNTNKHFTKDEDLPEELTSLLEIISVYHNTDIHYTSALLNLLFSNEPYNGIRFISAEYEEKLASLLQQNNYDIIQLEGPYMGYYIPVIKKFSNSLISLRAHNLENEIWLRKAQNEPSFIRSWYFFTLSKRIKKHETKILNSIDLLIAISERDQKSLLELNPGLSSVVIPAGVDENNYPDIQEPEYPSLFYIGSLDWLPNQEGLVWFIENVWPEVRQIEKLKFHIAGRNAPEWLKKKILANNIAFHGEVEDAYQFMNKYAIMVSPVFSGSGIRIKILEAMMMSKVVITTKIGAEGISCTHGENILLAEDPTSFAGFIYDYITNRSNYNRIAKNSRNFILENFNNMNFCQKLSEYYRNRLR